MIAGEIRGNLPLDIGPFVGRDALLKKVRRLLSHVRLLTLTGPGGVGKTRLALRVLKQESADGTWMIDIESVAAQADRSPASFYAHLALELGIHRNGVAGLDTVLDHLRGRRVLLALDNCESLVPEVRAFVRALLVAAPHVRILATSRQVLGVEGEHTLVVPPLDLLAASQLFIEHAAAAGADRKALDADPGVEELCTRLDGLPLAVRLAAARMSVLSVGDLLERLDDRFHVLKGIEGVVAWSYEQCSHAEQRLWAVASVFADAFDLEAITAIAAGAGMDPLQVMDNVAGLVQKSVLTAHTSTATTRYAMLNTVREYGERRLADAGDVERLRDLHCDYHRDLVGRAAASWLGPAELDVMAAVHRQLPDILAAIEHGHAGGDLAAARAICRDLVRCRAPFFFGFLELVSQHLQRVIDASAAAISNPAEAADVAAVAAMAGWIAVTVGRADDADKLIAAANDILEQWRVGAIPPLLFAEGGRKALGLGAREGFGMLAAVRALFSEEEYAGDRHMATMTWAMGFAFAGEPEAAVEATAEYLRQAEAAQAPWAISWALWTCALSALQAGDLRQATTYLDRCLILQSDMDDHWGQTWSIELAAWVAAAGLERAAKPRDHARRAAWLLGAAQARQDKIGVLMAGLKPFADRRALAHEQIASVLDEVATAAASADGRRAHAHAIRVALGDPMPRGPRAVMRDGLTGRELEIAQLVAQGHTSAAIGKELHIASATVDAHVKRILAKLGLRSRKALAAWVASRQT